MDERQASGRIRRRRKALYRKIFTVIFVLVIAGSVALFFGTQVTSNGNQEWVGGRDDTHALLLPLALFVVGVTGLAICLP